MNGNAAKRIKVIQCYTGGVGGRILKLLLANPAFEVVGVLVSGEGKHGTDAGEIVGLPPVGVKATMHLEEILALEADCAVYNGLAATIPGCPITPEGETEFAILKLLRSGKNVYAGPGGWYVKPGPERDLYDAACREGGVSFCAGGNIPGLISDALPLFVSGYVDGVTSVWCRQQDHLADHPSPHELRHHVGFGLEMDEQTGSEDAINALYEWSFRQSAEQVATAIGVTLDDFRLVRKELAAAPEDVKIGDLLIRKGQVAGARWTYSGFIGDHPWYTLICELTGAMKLGPDWRQDETQPQWTVKIEGSPSLHATMGALGRRDTIGPVLDLNASRAVNMIPLICAAQTGYRNLLDLPFVTAHHGHAPGRRHLEIGEGFRP